MSTPETLLYTKDHEWVKDNKDGTVLVGITDYAQAELGDVVFVDLPQIGKVIKAGESVATLESVKAVSDVYVHLSGEIIEVNTELTSAPQNLNSQPYTKGWILKLKLANSEELNSLLTSETYSAFIAEISK